MSGKGRNVPSLRRREILRALHRSGFVTIHTRGSHETLHHPDCRHVTVAIHPSAEAGPSIVRKIIRNAGLTEEQFLDKL